MKKLALLLVCIVLTSSMNAQKTNTIVEYGEGKKMLLGKVNKKGFDNEDFEWFDKNYEAYLSNDKVIELLKDSIKDYTIKAFFGSWCGDSRMHLPPFLKILDEANFDTNNVEIIALDRRKGSYKQAPNHEEKGLYIHRVPTFIFYKDGKEVNRIVEHPKTTLEKDMLNILTAKKQRLPYHQLSTHLHQEIESRPLDSLMMEINDDFAYYANYANGSRELNTFGYVLLEANELDKAEYLLKLNAKMFPYDYNVHGKLGELYYKKKAYKEALKHFYKSLSIKPQVDNHTKRVVEIEEILKKEKEAKADSEK